MRKLKYLERQGSFLQKMMRKRSLMLLFGKEKAKKLAKKPESRKRELMQTQTALHLAPSSSSLLQKP